MIGKNGLTVAAVIIAIVLLLGAGIAFAVAKTGLVQVPVFSAAYHGPTPLRVVTAAPMSESAFRALLTQQVQSQLLAGRTGEVTVRITEAELSGALQGAIQQSLREQSATADHVQLVVAPQFIELSGRLHQDGTTADLRVRLVPVIEDGGIRFDATDIHVGDYPVHPALAHRLAGILFSRDFGTWRISFGDIRFTSLTLQDGVIQLQAMPSTP